jgi:hypothetical protein
MSSKPTTETSRGTRRSISRATRRAADRHQVVGVEDRRRASPALQQAFGRTRAALGGEVALHHRAGRQAARQQRVTPRVAPFGAVHEHRRPRHVRDALVAEVDERPDSAGQSGALVGGHAGKPRCAIGVADDDGFQPQLGDKGVARVVEARVGDQHAVDAPVVSPTRRPRRRPAAEWRRSRPGAR